MFEATRRCQDQVCGPVSSFLVLFAGYSGTGGSNCPFKCCWQWTKLVYYEHVCVCFISSQLSSDFTSQSRDPELVVLVQGIMQYTGLQQCMALCRCCACVLQESRLARAWMGSQRSISTREGQDLQPCGCPFPRCPFFTALHCLSASCVI